MTTAAHRPLTFEVHGTEDRLTVSAFELVVAGYAGRDAASVQQHIDELAAIGIAPPDSVPTFFELAADLVTQADDVTVTGTNTSGEVEPVLIRTGGRLFLTVGSDHTDRDIERTDVAESKAACPKPVGRRVVELSAGGDLDWDDLNVHCSVDGVRYQEGSLASLRPTVDVLRMYDERTGDDRDLVIFGGTLPLIDGAFVPGSRWQMALTLPDGSTLDLAYTTTVTPH